MNLFFSRRIIVILFVVVVASFVLLTGCWDRKEVNDLALISGAAIDKKHGKQIELSLQLIIPKAAAGQEKGQATEQSIVESGIGMTIPDAQLEIQKKLSRRLFWSHNEVLVIGEQLAKEGIREHIDFLIRHPQPRQRTYIYVSKGKASPILKTSLPLERNSAERLREWGSLRLGTRVTLKQFLQMLVGDARTAAVPLVETAPAAPGNGKTILLTKGTAIFKKGKMVGTLDETLSKGIMLLRNEDYQETVSIRPKKAPGIVSFNIVRFQTKLIPEIKGDIWRIKVETFSEYNVVQNTTRLNMINPEISLMLEKDLSSAIEQQVRITLDKLQKELKADPVGFADAFHNKYPEQWKKVKTHWDQIFPKVRVAVNVQAKIRRPGMSTAPAGLPKSEVQE